MGRFNVSQRAYRIAVVDGKRGLLLRKRLFDRFNVRILGLGDLTREATPVDAICGVFDLEGFTHFSSQVDPHLALPEFMDSFLNWLFAKVRDLALAVQKGDDVMLGVQLPFFVMGDGVMFLWDTAKVNRDSVLNVPPCLANVSVDYGKELLPALRKRVALPPNSLRVGVARGRVLSNRRRPGLRWPVHQYRSAASEGRTRNHFLLQPSRL